MSDAPLPKFTIEELLREAVEPAPTSAFTTRELAKLWGYKALDTARGKMDALIEKGWRFTATRKDIVNRTGTLTSVNAYIIVPPAEEIRDTGNGENEDG